VTGYYERTLHRRFGCAYSPPVPARPRAVDPAYADGCGKRPEPLIWAATRRPALGQLNEQRRLGARAFPEALPRSVTNHRSHVTWPTGSGRPEAAATSMGHIVNARSLAGTYLIGAFADVVSARALERSLEGSAG
jgi:hypothetical protein